MPKLARNYQYNYEYEAYRQGYNTYPQRVKTAPQRPTTQYADPKAAQLARRKKQLAQKAKTKKKTNPLQAIAKLGVAMLLGGVVIPYTFSHITKPYFYNPINYRNISADYNYVLNPSFGYLHNNHFLNTPMLSAANIKKPIMQPLFESDRMVMLETRLGQLMQNYKSIQPAIYVWEYENGKYANINADEEFPTASIIKIPVLIEMFRAIESGEFKLYDKMTMGEHYRTSGSGSLQFRQANSVYSMDTLARHMIEESDNTSTNMIMSKIGGKHSVNRALRNWGMKHTRIENWLPDLGGSNVSTAREMSTMLYNINNDSLLNINSRESIIDYMSHVKNNRLLEAGLPKDAQLIHKTGDIGSMLGDAGIVYAPNGKRYVVTIFAKRPYNSPQGKEFIVEASKIIYDYVINGKV